jgi:ATP-binding cassette subfamily B (MDR/TAP) protein 1
MLLKVALLPKRLYLPLGLLKHLVHKINSLGFTMSMCKIVGRLTSTRPSRKELEWESFFSSYIPQMLYVRYSPTSSHVCSVKISPSLAFYYGTTLVLQGKADIGIVVNVFMAILIGSFSLAVAGPQIQVIMKGCAAAARLFETIDRQSSIDSLSTDGLRPTASEINGLITLEEVCFCYPSRPNVEVFKDMSLTFEAGKTTALVGPSGSGKSTIVTLIERFYDPLSGVVRLDGVDIKELNVSWLRSHIGLVSQEPTLFSTTIRDNVAHGLIGSDFENATPEKKDSLIRAACIKANADDFVSKLPQGYETLVGERGYLLSGGQKREHLLLTC